PPSPASLGSGPEPSTAAATSAIALSLAAIHASVCVGAPPNGDVLLATATPLTAAARAWPSARKARSVWPPACARPCAVESVTRASVVAPNADFTTAPLPSTLKTSSPTLDPHDGRETAAMPLSPFHTSAVASDSSAPAHVCRFVGCAGSEPPPLSI